MLVPHLFGATLLYLLCGGALAASLSPDDAVAAALSSNPDLAVAQAELTAASGNVRQSSFFRENPEVEGGWAVIGDRLDASVSQALSITGEGLADHRSARARRSAAEAGVRRARLEVAADTRAAYVEAVLAHQTAGFAKAGFDLASHQLAATEARVRVGESSDLELRLARLAQATAAGEFLAVGAEEAASFARLSTLAGRPVVGDDLVADPLDAAPLPEAMAVEERSDVVAARQELRAAEAAAFREHAAAFPALSLGAFYEVEGSTVTAGPAVGITVPLWHQNGAAIAVARGDVSVANARLTAAIARADADVRTASAANASAVTTMSAVPATHEDALAALASIEAGSRAGELDLVTTILLRGEVFSGQAALAAARADLALARITLLLATEDDALLGGVAP